MFWGVFGGVLGAFFLYLGRFSGDKNKQKIKGKTYVYFVICFIGICGHRENLSLATLMAFFGGGQSPKNRPP